MNGYKNNINRDRISYVNIDMQTQILINGEKLPNKILAFMGLNVISLKIIRPFFIFSPFLISFATMFAVFTRCISREVYIFLM